MLAKRTPSHTTTKVTPTVMMMDLETVSKDSTPHVPMMPGDMTMTTMTTTTTTTITTPSRQSRQATMPLRDMITVETTEPNNNKLCTLQFKRSQPLAENRNLLNNA